MMPIPVLVFLLFPMISAWIFSINGFHLKIRKELTPNDRTRATKKDSKHLIANLLLLGQQPLHQKGTGKKK